MMRAAQHMQRSRIFPHQIRTRLSLLRNVLQRFQAVDLNLHLSQRFQPCSDLRYGQHHLHVLDLYPNSVRYDGFSAPFHPAINQGAGKVRWQDGALPARWFITITHLMCLPMSQHVSHDAVFKW